MYYVFLACALVGGTIAVLQFVMAVVGFGADDLDFMDDVDFPDDVGDAQGDVLDHGSTWLFGVISFRTVIAAAAFFGLAGLAGLQSGQSTPVALVLGLVAGIVSMYGVHFLMQLLVKLRHDGTIRIEKSLGTRGKVYLPIPGNNDGAGKVQLRLEDRIVEYEAITSESEKLPTGATIEVVEIVSPTRLAVKLIDDRAHAKKSDAVA